MNLIFILLLAIVQGLTEFLPVSSSAHLILLRELFGIQDNALALDVAVHLGSLFAVIIYFHKDVLRLVHGTFDILRLRTKTADAKLVWLLALATIPVLIFGYFLKVTGYIDLLRNNAVIGITMIVFGLILYYFDQKGGQSKRMSDWNVKDALIMGLWQAVALIPGTSRSGATVTAARSLNYQREDGTTLAMLMSIPTILASGLLLTKDVVEAGDTQFGMVFIFAILAAFFAAYFSLRLMMYFLKSTSFTPYVIYRVILGAILLLISFA